MAHMVNIIILLLCPVKRSFLQQGSPIGPSPMALLVSVQFALAVAAVGCTITSVALRIPMRCKAAVAVA